MDKVLSIDDGCVLDKTSNSKRLYTTNRHILFGRRYDCDFDRKFEGFK